MGRMFKKSRKFGFNRLADIRYAYNAAFGSEAKEVFEGTDFDSLSVLEAVRHVLVHRGGKVDASFLHRVKDHEKYPEFADLIDEQTLELDGTLIRRCMEGSTSISKNLLSFVDKWLGSHEGKTWAKLNKPASLAQS